MIKPNGNSKYRNGEFEVILLGQGEGYAVWDRVGEIPYYRDYAGRPLRQYQDAVKLAGSLKREAIEVQNERG